MFVVTNASAAVPLLVLCDVLSPLPFLYVFVPPTVSFAFHFAFIMHKS